MNPFRILRAILNSWVRGRWVVVAGGEKGRGLQQDDKLAERLLTTPFAYAYKAISAFFLYFIALQQRSRPLMPLPVRGYQGREKADWCEMLKAMDG